MERLPPDRQCGCGEPIWYDPVTVEWRHADPQLDQHHLAELQLSLFDKIIEPLHG